MNLHDLDEDERVIAETAAAFAEKLEAAGAATEVIVIDWYPSADDPLP